MNISDWIKRHALFSPDKVALRFDSHTFTYREFEASICATACVLKWKLGVGQGERVAFLSYNCPEFLITLFACARIGALFVPLNWRLTVPEHLYILRNAAPKALLLQEPFATLVTPATEALPHCQIVGLDFVPDGQQAWERLFSAPLEKRGSDTPYVDLSNPLLIVYTSGTTGYPKGAVHTQNAVQWNASNNLHLNDLTSADHILTVRPLFHVGGFNVQTLPAFYCGATVTLHTTFDPEQVLETISAQRPTITHLVPSMMRACIDSEWWHKTDFTSLRTLLTGTTIIPQALCDAFRAKGVQVAELYGATETCPIAIYKRPDYPRDKPTSIGVPALHCRVRVVDSDGNDQPTGVAGEILIKGPNVMLGYWHAEREAATTQALRNGWYHTGDMGYCDEDGYYFISGRKKNLIIKGGENIYPAEVERVLNTHPDIQESAVVGVPDPEWQEIPVAVLVARDNVQLSTLEIRSYLSNKLAAYKIPHRFMLTEALPKNAMGKVQHFRVKEELSQSVEIQSKAFNELNYIPPRTPTEEILVTIWAELLGIERVGVGDNFFHLGGHSLLATQVSSRVAKAFGLNLAIQALFESPTIAQLAEHIEERQSDIQNFQLVERKPTQMTRRTRTPGELPLSYAQQRLWFLDQFEGPSPTYNIFSAYRLTGSLQVTALAQAIHEIIRRHEVLRTTFPIVDGQPVQRIAPLSTLPAPTPSGTDGLAVVDLQHLTGTEQKAFLDRCLAEEAKRPFNLAEGPLLRVTLYQCSETEQLLLLNIHHIISDGWSLALWWQELDTLYQAFAAGKPSPLPELPLQYADFTQWQHSWLTQEVLEKQLAYWREQLAGAPILLELPTDHARPPAQTFNSRFIDFEIPPELTRQLRDFSLTAGVTLFMTLEAAFALLLSRYSGLEDIVIGTLIANRHYQEIEPLIGFFVNTLPLRTDLSGNPTFEQLLERVRQVTLDAYAHQDIPIEHLVSELVSQRNLSHAPLIQITFQMQDAFFARKSLGDLSLELLKLENVTANFDLNIMLYNIDDGRLAGYLEYDTNLFEQASIERMIGHYLRLLTGIVQDARQPINQLPLLTEAETHQLLVQWNKTDVSVPTEQCFHQLFEAQVARTPDAQALVYSLAGEIFTYRELNERANQLAHHLRALGVKPEVVVGVSMERCPETVISLLAIFKAGGVYIPLDPALPQKRLSYMLTNSQAKVVLTKSQYATPLSQLIGKLEPLRHSTQTISLDTDWSLTACPLGIAQQPKRNLVNLSTPQNLAYVIYTSGSTGLPKGAMIEHQGMVNHLYTKIIDLKMNAGDRLAETAPQSFDISIWQFLSALLVGGAVHIFDDETVHNPSQLLARTEAEKITILEVVPSLFRFMLDEVATLGVNRPEFSALRWLMLTGEALPPHLCREWFPYYPDIPLVNAYGPTECSDDVTHHVIYETPPVVAITVPIGRAVPNMRLYILDRDMQPVPIGVPGELYVGGIGVGRGYLNDPEQTAKAFMDDPFVPGQKSRFYKTGDLVRYRPDGTIEYLGRLDHQVKIRGHRIELGEIEAALTKHPAVRQSLVIALPSQNWQEGATDYSLVAYIAASPAPTVTEWRRHLSETQPNYMIPAAFVTLDAFPLTPNGKINRKALPVPEITREEETRLPPRTQSEEVVANIWAEVLGLERISIEDDFFDLGGDSLLAIPIISRLREAFQAELSVRIIFESPTIAQLAQTIDAQAERNLSLA